MAVAGFAFEGGRLARSIGWLGLTIAAGCALIWLRSQWVAEPRLQKPVVAAFEATVERVEPIASKGDLRLTLLPRVPPFRPESGFRSRRTALRRA